MNHFLLPDIPASEQGASGSLRYGSFAMEQLVNAILSRGGKRERLEVKVFGGGNVVKGLSGVGHRNSDFIENFLKNEGIPVMSSDLRGSFARRVQYMPSTGQVRMRKLADDAARRIHKKETAKSVKTKVVEDTGSIELFD
jgi:chemotaxis protein CheD